ncbi:MAG: hypothetical protein LH628_07405 [Microcoleus sp. CAN_BIN18]|nr:hypothetical protein [Microcoleus sp. CAN_BIN18]
MSGIQSRRVRQEQTQLFCTRSHMTIHGFCTILPIFHGDFTLDRASATFHHAICDRLFSKPYLG